MLNIKTIKTAIISTIGMLALSGCSLFCGPNMSDVGVMKPMAQKISDYIVKNGIPESLKDIPDLPYGLVECNKKRADEEARCIFIAKDKKYDLTFFMGHETHYILILNQEKTHTAMISTFDMNLKTLRYTVNKSMESYRDEITGRCAPKRQ